MKRTQPLGRKEKALVTRRRMLSSAYELFCANGYGGTTMDLIAKRADVAVQTLYFTFHTKAAILEETFGAAVLGFEIWDPRAVPIVASDPRQAFAEFHPWFAAFERAKTQALALAVFIDVSLDILARIGPLVGVMNAAAADAGIKAMMELGEQRRVDAYRIVIEMLAQRGGLRRGVSVRHATDILLTMLSAETHEQLAGRRGWSRAACRKWLVEVLGQQLLPAA